jgi:Tol biopolymer transport system component
LVYFQTERPGLSIFSVDPLNPEPGTPAVRVTPIEDSDNFFPSVSTDASTLAFFARTTAGREIILQNLATGEHTVVLFDTPVVLDLNGSRQHVELSPDGNQVAFVGFVGFVSQVFVADISGLR